jgi:hypothetical protein
MVQQNASAPSHSTNTTIIITLVFIVIILIILGIIYLVVNIENIVLNQLYKKYFFQLWPVVSKAPELLNAAFPDFTIQYYLMSFPKNSPLQIIGKIPDFVSFSSIVIYDTHGLPLQSWNDSQFSDNLFSITYTTIQDCCLIVRYYIDPNIVVPLLPDFLPQITLLTTSKTQTWQSVSDQQIIQNSNGIQNLVYKLCMKQSQHYNFSDINYNKFFLPNPSHLNLLFPNPNAMYLMVFPGSNNVIRIRGILPPSIGKTENVRFIGFMASNLSTSATDDSLSSTQMMRQYTLYVAYTKEDAIQYGYKPNDNLLLWKSSNNNPVVIYRQVQINSTGLFYYQSATSNISSTIIEKAMFPFYPQVTIY